MPRKSSLAKQNWNCRFKNFCFYCKLHCHGNAAPNVNSIAAGVAAPNANSIATGIAAPNANSIAARVAAPNETSIATAIAAASSGLDANAPAHENGVGFLFDSKKEACDYAAFLTIASTATAS